MSTNRGVPAQRVRSFLMVGAVVVLTGVGCWNCGQKQKPNPYSTTGNNSSSTTGNNGSQGYRSTNLPGGNQGSGSQTGVQGNAAQAGATPTPTARDSSWGNSQPSGGSGQGSPVGFNPTSPGTGGVGMGTGQQTQPMYSVPGRDSTLSQENTSKFGATLPEPAPSDRIQPTSYNSAMPSGPETPVRPRLPEQYQPLSEGPGSQNAVQPVPPIPPPPSLSFGGSTASPGGNTTLPPLSKMPGGSQPLELAAPPPLPPQYSGVQPLPPQQQN